MPPRPPLSTPSPYTTLFRSRVFEVPAAGNYRSVVAEWGHYSKDAVYERIVARPQARAAQEVTGNGKRDDAAKAKPDRKSTRLNSSHLVISYAVFCLKKKKR